MKELITKKMYEEFMVNGEIFKIDISPVSMARFAVTWTAMRERLEEATREAVATVGLIRALPEKVSCLTETEKLSELNKLSALYDEKIRAVLACAKEIINARLLDEPFDAIYKLCGGDMGELTRVVALITEIVNENK